MSGKARGRVTDWRRREWFAVFGVGLLALSIGALIVLTPWHAASLLHGPHAQRGPERVVAVTAPGHTRSIPSRSTPNQPARPAPADSDAS